MKRLILIICVTSSIYLFIPLKNEVKAMDPVTMAALAPVAISFAKIAAPYVIKGLKHMVIGIVDMGKDVIDIFRLPIGFFESTFLAPWYFYDGLRNLIKGGIAPFKLCIDAITLPIRPFGALM